jgi:hypothetical protein
MDISKLNPEVYRRGAARILTQQELYSCRAIKNQCFPDWASFFAHRDFFSEIFQPVSIKEMGSEFNWWNDFHPHSESRTLALLLCADILESEQKAQRSRKR